MNQLNRWPLTKSFISNRPKVFHGHDVENAVGDNRSAVDLAVVHFDFSQKLHGLAVRENMHVAVTRADIDFAIDPQGGAPDLGFGIVNPKRLAGIGVQAVKKAGDLVDIEQAVVDGAGADRSAENVFAIELVRGGLV